MERDPRSKSHNGYAARPPKNSGAVIQDDINVSNNKATHVQIPNPQESFNREANLYLPMANVIRIMRRTLPADARIADDAKETIQECASEFIDHITREANAICHRDHRKTITPEDVLFAMDSTKFHNYAETLTRFLRKYKEEDLARNFMHGKPFVGPDVGSVQSTQNQVAEEVVGHGPQIGPTGPMSDFYRPNSGEGSSNGTVNAGFDFPSDRFDVYKHREQEKEKLIQ